MLSILNKNILMDKSPILYQETFTKDVVDKYWKIYSGDWSIEGEWLTGKNPDDSAGFIISKEKYPGNIILDFEARTVPPCDNDINFLWNTSMIEETGELGSSYIGSIAGWWEGKTGIEKSPEYNIYAATSDFKLFPGETYHIQAGSIDGHCFMFINGKLIIELIDFKPIDYQKHCNVGFDVWASYVQLRNLTIRKPVWESKTMTYAELRNNKHIF